eukprot:TRINITY_DN56119_c0_g1_i1.p1 TRINITY_DN56119_c0_g1~~TRINITY_DN56119_c0_g1_i1.p1  ORF type:complete len:627 (+),score=55.87 TRINITY_DN56119_c0_g1_i1:106-1986(+)
MTNSNPFLNLSRLSSVSTTQSEAEDETAATRSAGLDLPDLVCALVFGNLATLVICSILYLNYCLFRPYFTCLVWAILVSQALHLPKRAIVKQVNDWRRQGMRGSLTCGRMPRSVGGMHGAFIVAGIAVAYVAAPRLVALGAAVGMLVGSLFLAFAHCTRLLSPDTLVTITLLLAGVLAAVFLSIFFFTECVHEGIEVVTHLSAWARSVLNEDSVQRMYDTRRDLADEVLKYARSVLGPDGRLNATEALQFVGLNATHWGPLAGELERYLQRGARVAGGNTSLFGSTNDPNTSVFNNVHTFSRNLFSTYSGGSFSINGVSHAYKTVAKSVGRFDMRAAAEHVLSASSFVFGTSAFVVGGMLETVVSLLFHSVNFMVNFCIFFTVLFYLLQSKHDCIHYLLLPLSPEVRPALSRDLRRVVSDVLLLPIKKAFVHGVLTVLLFWLFGLDFRAFAASVAALFAAVPYLSAWLVCMPWVLALVLQECYARAAAFTICYYLAMTQIGTLIYDELTIVHPYITYLSVFMGVTSFGGEGALFGPLLVCIAMAIYRTWRTYALHQSLRPNMQDRPRSPRVRANVDTNQHMSLSPRTGDARARASSLSALNVRKTLSGLMGGGRIRQLRFADAGDA